MDNSITPQTVLYELGPSPARLWIGVGSYAIVGLFMLYVAAWSPPSDVLWLLALLGMGGGALWQGWRMFKTLPQRLVLTEEALRFGSGEVLVRLDDVQEIDRSLFTFKPSGGFVLVLKERAPRGGMPGLWWRTGRRIGIGGTVAGWNARGMADLIQAILMQRDARV